MEKKQWLNKDDVLEYLYLIIIFLALINNVPHLADVHYSVTESLFSDANDWANHLVSNFSVLIFDAVMFALILRGERVWTGLLSLLILALNADFYNLYELYSEKDYSKLISAGIFCLAYSVTPWVFSELYYHVIKTDQEESQMEELMKQHRSEAIRLRAELDQRQQQLTKLQATIDQQAATLKQHQANTEQERQELHQLRLNEQQRLAELKCKYGCGYQAETPAQQKSHHGHCERNDKRRKA